MVFVHITFMTLHEVFNTFKRGSTIMSVPTPTFPLPVNTLGALNIWSYLHSPISNLKMSTYIILSKYPAFCNLSLSVLKSRIIVITEILLIIYCTTCFAYYKHISISCLFCIFPQVTDPSAPIDEGITALHNAICAGHYGIVKFLIEFGCNVNAPDSDGW